MSPRFIFATEIQEGDVIAWQSRQTETLIWSRVSSVEEYENPGELDPKSRILCKGITYEKNGVTNLTYKCNHKDCKGWVFDTDRTILLIERNTNGSL